MVDTQFYINKGPFSLRQIAEICEAELADSGKADVVIKDIATMAKAGAEEICFFYDKKAKGKAAEIKASACVTTAELAPFLPSGVTALIAANPKRAGYYFDLQLLVAYAAMRAQHRMLRPTRRTEVYL